MYYFSSLRAEGLKGEVSLRLVKTRHFCSFLLLARSFALLAVSPLSHKAGFAGALFLWAREFSPFSRSLLTFLAKQESKNPLGDLAKK